MNISKQCPKCNTEHNMNGKFCSRSCANSRGPRSEETKAKIGKAAKANPSGCILDQSKAYRPKPKYKEITFICIHCAKEFIVRENKPKKYCSISCYRNSGNCGGYKPGTTGKAVTEYNGIRYDSGSEAAFAKLLDESNIQFIRNTKTFFIYDNTKKYYPDFYIPEYDCWVEIKGRYYYRESVDLLKWASVPNLHVVWHDNIHLPNFGDAIGIQTRFSC